MDETHPFSMISFPEACKLYEDGKHRRYDLLFAVNGGAFAIAKLITPQAELGGLRRPHIAAGMVLFTILIVFDIFTFGDKWASLGKRIVPVDDYEFFSRRGRIVLAAIGLLICTGWLLSIGLL